MVIWVIGLSGAGKTTIGSSLFKKIKQEHKNTVLNLALGRLLQRSYREISLGGDPAPPSQGSLQ